MKEIRGEGFLSKEDKQLFDFFEEKCGIIYDDKEKSEILDFFDFFNENNNVSLNLEQKKAVLCDADVLKIVASAGAGKTATLVAKVNYLINVKNVDPSKILCLSFSRKSVKDLKRKLTYSFSNKWNKDLENNIYDSFSNDFKDNPVKVKTFHAFGYSFLNQKVFSRFKDEDDQNQCIKELFEDFITDEIFNKPVIFELFKLYFPEIFNHRHNLTKKEKNDLSTQKKLKIKSKRANTYSYYLEALKEDCLLYSFPDLVVADFLILNDVEFEYGKSFTNDNEDIEFDFFIPHKNSNNGIYLDDHRLDQYGIAHDLKKDGDALIKFKHYLEDVKKIQKEYLKDDLIIMNSFKNYGLFYDFSLHDQFTKILENELLARGINLNPKKFTRKSLKTRLTDLKFFDDLEYIIKIIIRFIELFKQHNFTIDKINKFEGKGAREKFLLFLISKFYEKYQYHLDNNDLVDFSDMIIKSIDEIKKLENLDYDYILVDEYQDISKIRYELLRTIKDVSNAKLTVVGDDWQSIYGFTGCELEYFKYFKRDYFTNAKEITLETTYRFKQELIDISSEFILYDSSLSDKYLKADELTENEKIKIDDEIAYLKNLEEDMSEKIDEKITFLLDSHIDSFKPIEILKYPYPEYQNKLVYTILKSIYFKIENGLMEGNKVLILSRYNENLDKLKKDLEEHFNLQKYDLDISYSTIHKAKGLESDNVILLDFNNKSKGIPSRVRDVDILRFVSPGDTKEKRKERRYYEERRVFYVALTRTKNKVYLCTQYGKESDFYYDLLKIDRKKLKLRIFRPSKKYDPFRVEVKPILNNYWYDENKVKEITTLDYLCPNCKKNQVKLYEIEDKRVIVCPDYNNGCDYYVKKFIYNFDDLKIKRCSSKCKGFRYYNRLNFNARMKRFCSNPNCPKIKKQKEKEKKINLEEGQQTLT